MTYPAIKYYGTLIVTFLVLALSTEHISESLKVVENYNSSEMREFFTGTLMAAAGLNVFEILVGIGIADLIMRKEYNKSILFILILILLFFFAINVIGNILYAFKNMANMEYSSDINLSKIYALDSLQVWWVLWAAVPIPLMGISGIIVQSIFRRDYELSKKIEIVKEPENKIETIEKIEPVEIVKKKD